MKRKIERRLAALVGARFHGAHCAASMLMAGFGPLIDWQWTAGSTLSVPRFALHVQVAWRLVEGSHVVVGFDDEFAASRAPLVRPGGGVHEEATRCDELLGALRTRLADERVVVREVEADPTGGVVVRMSKKLRLDVFPSASNDEELWRFFAFDGPDPHFIVHGTGAAQ